MKAPRAYKITRDGQLLAKTLTGADAVHYLHTIQPYSVNHAIMFEGYDIIDPDGVAWSDNNTTQEGNNQ